ncbi:MAG: spore coat protein [Clostridia bacterium]|nr:spore coat protein [Clostridia bacterium]
MNISLNDKQINVLKEQKEHEQICIQKYLNYANQTQNQELKDLFNSYASQEQNHYDTINQILNGDFQGMPNSSQQQQPQPIQNNNSSLQSAMSGVNDAELCKDMLMTEKFVSGTYNDAVFDFTNTNIAQALQHIQKEEQQHGEGIANFMANNGMAQPE